MTCLYEVELVMTAAGHVQFVPADGVDRITDPIGIPDIAIFWQNRSHDILVYSFTPWFIAQHYLLAIKL